MPSSFTCVVTCVVRCRGFSQFREDHPMELARRKFLTLGTFSALLALGACATHSGGPAPTPTMTGGKVEIQWLGQSATRITSPTGKVIVIDPFITGNPKTP